MRRLLGIGTDIISVERLAAVLNRHGDRALKRLFTPAEIAHCSKYADPYPHLAGRFAAKEAVSKALGTGMSRGITFSSIEIRSGEGGAPYAHLVGKAAELARESSVERIHVSISHEEKYAVAFAAIEVRHFG
jgi:holo-[acyl-carrier protein] synthase